MDKNMRSNQHCGVFRLLVLAMAVLFLLPLISLGTIQASAAEPDPTLPVVRVENKTVHRGQTFELKIYLDQNPGLISLMLELDYNKEVMELVGVSHGNALATHTFTTSNTGTEDGFLITPFRMLWDGRAQDTTTGVLTTLTFESKVDAPIGEYPVTVSYDRENTNVAYGVPCDVQIENGTVTLIKGAYTVKYLNYDGTLLYEKDYSESSVPSYSGEVPQRPADDHYSYEFDGWRGVVSDVSNVICYEAQYKLTPRIYQVFFFVDDTYFNAFECAYGSLVDLSQIPSEKNHVFDGWYTDKALTQRITAAQMPACDLYLYGQMKFNVREDPIPEITLGLESMDETYAYVTVDVTKNPSISGLVLTLHYDREALTLEGFVRGDAFSMLQFDYTNTDQGFAADPFRFYWEHTTNTIETGRLLTLKFKVNHAVKGGMYAVSMTYEPTSDALYIDENANVAYTRLQINGVQVPIGEIHYWDEKIEGGDDDTNVIAECPGGMPADTKLYIQVATATLELSDEKIQAAVGAGMELKAAYKIELLRNNVKVQPDGELIIRIKLTDAQLHCKDLRVYYVDDNQNMTLYDSHIEDGYIVFTTTHLSHWAIVGEAPDAIFNQQNGVMPTNANIIIVAFTLLAISCMALCMIVFAKKRDLLIAKSNKKGGDNT